MVNNPFLAAGWDKPFLPWLKSLIIEKTDGQPGKALIITPNQRPWRYFNQLFVASGKPWVLPKMMPFSQVASIWRASALRKVMPTANALDQIALLHESVKNLAKDDPVLSAHFGRMEIAQFLPWGMRVAKLFEELCEENKTPADLPNTEGETSPLAAGLLNALGRLFGAWQAGLAKKGYTTQGLDHYLASKFSDRVPKLLQPSPQRPVFIAGFASPNGTQYTLLRKLWEQGAIVCVHASPDGARHWSCAPILNWANKWHAELEQATADSGAKPKFNFYAAYDCHSQLEKLGQDLQIEHQDSSSPESAVILPDPGTLIPALHHLPKEDVNISMGYPLTRSNLASLIESIFQALLRKRPVGQFYWQDLLRIVGHPYLEMLERDDETGHSVRLRQILRQYAQCIRKGGKYQKWSDSDLHGDVNYDSMAKAFMDECLTLILDQISNVKTPAELAGALGAFCDFILAHGQTIFENNPLDGEALTRLKNNILPVLAESDLAHAQFDLSILHSLLNMLFENERVPYEAFPLVGLQVLGFKEARLLNFENLYFVDASDEVFPGRHGQDPLLPDSLRPLAGLPDDRKKRQLAAYEFYRLCGSAKKVCLYWQEGGSTSEVGSNRKFRSRFVEQLLWQEEQRLWADNPASRDGIRDTIKKEYFPLKTAIPVVAIAKRIPAPIIKTPNIKKAIASLLNGKISAAFIKDYLYCPIQFVYKRVLKLEQPSEIRETDDPLLVGEIFHDTLKKLLEPFVNQPLGPGMVERRRIRSIFEEQLEMHKAGQRLPPDSFLILEHNGLNSLTAYLENMPAAKRLLGIESNKNRIMELNGRKYSFFGRIDRLEERAEGRIILDYKTSTPKSNNPAIWEDCDFFTDLQQYCEGNQSLDSQTLLMTIRENLPNLQLLIYLLLCKADQVPLNAAFVDLSEQGQEIHCFNQELPDEVIVEDLENFKKVLAFLLKNIEVNPAFDPNLENCEYCDYAQICYS